MKAIQFLLMAAIVFLSSANVLAQKDPAKAGEELMKKKKYAEAISAFSEAIKLEPKLHTHYYHRALCEVKSKKTSEAKADFEKSIALNKKYIPAYLQLGHLAKNEKNFDEAIKHFDQAIAIEADPKKKSMYTMMVVETLIKKGDLTTAQQRIEPVQKAAPNNLKVIACAADIKAAKKDWNGCVAEYQKAIALEGFKKLKPEQKAPYYYAIGTAYIQLKDMKNAKASWEKAYIGSFKTKIEQEQPEWAVEYTDKAMEIKNNPEANVAPDGSNANGDNAAWGNDSNNTTNSTNSSSSSSSSSSGDEGGSSGSGENIDWGF